MTSFFLTFLAVALAMLAGREAVRVARLAHAGAGALALLGAIAFAAIAGCAVAAWLAGEIAGLLPPDYRVWLVAGALALAALEVLLLSAPKAPREPTHSIGAVAIVLLAGVVTDASGLLVLSLSVATGEPVFVAAGGALAVIAVLGAGALTGADWEKLPHATLRYAVAALLLGAAIMIGISPPPALS